MRRSGCDCLAKAKDNDDNTTTMCSRFAMLHSKKPVRIVLAYDNSIDNSRNIDVDAGVTHI